MSNQDKTTKDLTDIQRRLALIKVANLAEIEPVSKDSLTTHGVYYARSLNAYREAVGNEWRAAAAEKRAINRDAYDGIYSSFEVASALYAPGLIGALARAVVELASADRGAAG